MVIVFISTVLRPQKTLPKDEPLVWLLKDCWGKFPGGPVVRTPLSLPGAQVQPLVGKLRAHKPQGYARKEKKNLLGYTGSQTYTVDFKG